MLDDESLQEIPHPLPADEQPLLELLGQQVKIKTFLLEQRALLSISMMHPRGRHMSGLQWTCHLQMLRILTSQRFGGG